ncbi:MAG: SDR family oxidoreductase [Rhodoferax sp.]
MIAQSGPLVTVMGGRGYIGRHLLAYLQRLGVSCWAPERGDAAIFERHLGTVYYCVGLTADFRTRPFDTVEAHIGLLRELLQGAQFDQLIYLSSTRVYLGAASTHEDQALVVQPQDADDLYKLSKLMGESLALHSGRNCKVVRLSNVVGGADGNPESFVYSLLREAKSGRIVLRSHPDTAKDYIHIDDVVTLLPQIASRGRQRIYNVATGLQTSHLQWLDFLAARTGCSWTVAQDAPLHRHVRIDNRRIVSEFPRVWHRLPDDFFASKES